MKKIKLHGMSSEKASRVKKRGHKKEYIYATLIMGKVVRGTKKEDVVDMNGKIHSLKGGGEIKGGEGRKGKWQRLPWYEAPSGFRKKRLSNIR